MKPAVVLLCLAPTLLATKPPSPTVQSILQEAKTRLEAYQKAVYAHLSEGKPIQAFPDSLEADQTAFRARLDQEKRPEARMALGMAVCAFKVMDVKKRVPLDARDLAFLRTIPMESPLWILLPHGPGLLAQDFKDAAQAEAFLARFTDRTTVPEVRQGLLFGTFMTAHQAKDTAAAAKALARLEEEFPKAEVTATARDYAAVRVQVGAPAPAFRVRTLENPGLETTLETFKGQYLLIDFWATWCGPCKAMLPDLHKVHAEYRDKGLVVLSVADDKGPEVVQAFRRQPGTPMPWHHVVNVYDPKTRTRPYAISHDYGVHTLPTMVLVGPDGRVAADHDTLHKDLEGTLARFLGPVDHASLAKESADVLAGIQKAAQAHRAGGAKEPFKVDPAVLAPFRTRAEGAVGARREAAMLQEFVLAANCQLPSAFKDRILKEISPASEAWRIAPEFAPHLEQVLGAEAKPYVAALRARGIPEVRAAFLALDAMRLLEEEGRPQDAKAAVDQAQALAPASQLVKMVAAMVAGSLKTTLGQPAPDFRVPDLENPGRFHTLADFRGRYVLLDFWGTWCGWCVKELPTTHAVYAKFKDKGLEILSVAKEAKAETVAAFRRKPGFPMPWRHGLLDERPGHKDPMVEAYGVTGYPSLFLIGPDGRLVAKGAALREAELEKTLAGALRP
ncbi:TlpA disulfide reductase family protein [Mesoterricola sediminis]|uniref:Thioredoxin domain-containing protein n=1 Tax=Mesoterricola sediminis TaxID=2927980 RepID=A0AA48GYC8_9BACT|nr:TlpA disulfide reductase family protein [Mesoterricola sediminis]BDU78539.1 hypothetical protein METESE_34970 [Mesoterricola sediminis]